MKNYISIYLTIFFLYLPCLTFGQKLTKDDAAFRQLLVKADSLYQKAAFDSTLCFMLKEISDTYYYESELDKSIDFEKKHLFVLKKVYGENALSVYRAHNSIGETYRKRGDFSNALKHLKLALEGYINSYGVYSKKLSGVYLKTAMVYTMLGNDALANAYYEKVLRIEQYGKTQKNSMIADALYNQAILFRRQKKYAKAIQNLKKGMEIQRTLGAEGVPITWYKSLLGKVLADMGKVDEGLEMMKNSLNQKIEAYGELSMTVGSAHSGLGETYKDLGRYEEALEHFEQVLAIDYALLGQQHFYISLDLIALAEVYTKKGQYSKSLRLLQKALCSNAINFNDSTNIFVNPSTVACFDQITLIENLYLKAYVLSKNPKVKYREFALETFVLADRAADKFRHGNAMHADKLNVGSISKKIYEGAIDLCFTLYAAHQNVKYLEQAFHFMEKGRGNVLRDALAGIEAKKFAGIPEELLEQEEKLLSDITYFQSILSEARQTGEVKKETLYKEKLFQTNLSHRELTLKLEQEYPNYYQLKYQDQTIELGELQSYLTPEEAVVEYFRGDSTLYAIFITSEDIEMRKISERGRVIQAVKELRKLVSSNQQEDINRSYFNYHQYASFLYQNLLAPFLKGKNISKLNIIPDGELGYLPFELLLTKTDEPAIVDYRTLPYLFQNMAISYGYSAILLFDKKAIKGIKKGVLAIGPSYHNIEQDSTEIASLGKFRSTLTSLLWNEKEAERISDFFGGKSLVGAAASEEQFKQLNGEFDVLHFAMHALVDDEDPMNSRLVFTQNEDETEDDQLYVHELYNMEINAQLVVLSACNTAVGKLHKGEGVMSIGRAFAYAGCPSIAMTHWQVDDASAIKLMEGFYQGLTNGLTKSEALRQAQVAYLQTANPRESHPFYWASFVVQGDDQPINPVDGFAMWPIIVFALGGVFLLIFKLKPFQKR